MEQSVLTYKPHPSVLVLRDPSESAELISEEALVLQVTTGAVSAKAWQYFLSSPEKSLSVHSVSVKNVVLRSEYTRKVPVEAAEISVSADVAKVGLNVW